VTPRADLGSVNVLDVVPVRLADWEDDGGRVVLIRPYPRAPWYLLPIEWLRWALAVRRVRLDETGSAAWRACDGARPVSEIAGAVRDRFGAAAEPVETRLGLLIRRLRREGLLAYRGHDDLRGAATSRPHPPPG
jgi:hypothetical protein